MYDPMQPYQQDFLNGFGAMPLSNRNPLAAAKKVAPPVIPKATGRIGSLPSPKKKPVLDAAQLELQQHGFDPHAMDGEMWAGSRQNVLAVPRDRQPVLPPPSPIPQGRPTPPVMPNAQTAYDYLPSFSNPGQVQQAPQVMPGLLPDRPQIQQSYAMPTQRPGFLPQGMGVAPMPTYQRGGVIGPETQGLMNQVLQKQLMDQLNYKSPSTDPGALDGIMSIVSGLAPGSSKYLDGQLANRQNNRTRAAMLSAQQADNQRASIGQMLQGISANDPLSLAAQNQLFNQQSDWQKNQIAGVQAGTGAFTAEDNGQRWRAQLPSQQWVDQQGAVNQAGQVRNQGETNRINDSYHAQQERQAIADREQAWKIAQMQNQLGQNEIRFKDINSQRQYGVNGGKPKQASPADLAKAIAQLYTKDGTPIIQDPQMHEQLVNQLAMQLGVDPAMLKPAQEAEPQGFDFMKALGGLFSQGQQQKAPPPTGLAALSDAELQKLRAAHAPKKKQPKASK